MLIGVHWSAKKVFNKFIFWYTFVINVPLDKIGGIRGILIFWRSLLRIDQYDLAPLCGSFNLLPGEWKYFSLAFVIEDRSFNSKPSELITSPLRQRVFLTLKSHKDIVKNGLLLLIFDIVFTQPFLDLSSSSNYWLGDL